jgi:hypothetical protein
MLPRRLAATSALVLAACGGGGSSADAPPDIDNGSCGDMLRFTGEYVDWDTDAKFCGINMAVLEVQGGGAMDSTNPNGRFDLCIPSTAATTKLDVTQPAGNSECTAVPSGYSIKTLVVANKAVILAGGFQSARAWTTDRQATFFSSIGQTYDSNKAQVHVHVDGTARAVSLSAAHGATQAIMTTTWAPGDTGHEVFFPNVDVGSGTAMLTVAGGATGTGAIPLVANTITSVTVLAH